jgi:hypothetical protein
METVLLSWNPAFAQALVINVLGVIGAGIFLVGIAWLLGYVVNSLFRFFGYR